MNLGLFLITLLGFQFSAFSQECSDFSGQYRIVGLELTDQTLVISQNNCAEIKMEFNTTRADGTQNNWVNDMVVDGQKREVTKNYRASYQFDGRRLIESVDVRTSDGSWAPAHGVWAWDEKGLLIYNYESAQGGLPIRARYKRQ